MISLIIMASKSVEYLEDFMLLAKEFVSCEPHWYCNLNVFILKIHW